MFACEFTCSCGHKCKMSDGFRTVCEGCKLPWMRLLADLSRHFEEDIETPDQPRMVYGSLRSILVSKGMKPCMSCGEVYDPAQYDACPGLFPLALSMLETRGEDHEIPPSAKALNYLIERKSQLRAFWMTRKSNFSAVEIQNYERVLAGAGLLSEIQ